MIENSIVAVHGIGAHPYYSWQFSEEISKASQDGSHVSLKREVHWLKDEEMLPQACPDGRVMTFGYESQWFGAGAIKQKLSSLADGLLQALRNDRRVWMTSSLDLEDNTEIGRPRNAPYDRCSLLVTALAGLLSKRCDVSSYLLGSKF